MNTIFHTVTPEAEPVLAGGCAPGSARNDLLGPPMAAISPVLFTGASRRHELIAAYPELAPICDQLGFGAMLSIREWSAAPEWALVVLARCASPPLAAPVQDWSQAEIAELIDDLIEHHHRPLRNELRRLGILIGELTLRHADADVPLLDRIFTRLEHSILVHMEQEERTLFPQCLAIEAASRGHGEWDRDTNGVTISIRSMMSGHNEGETELSQVLVLVDALARRLVDPDVNIIRAGMVAMKSDLARHASKERDILMPAAIFAEEQLRARRPSFRRPRPG